MPQRLHDSPGLHWTRALVVALLAFITYLTVSYCFHMYYDRELAFRDALSCSTKVLEENNVEFWLLNGTLLGCQRLGRLIIWDVDLDLGFLNSKHINISEVMTLMDTRCFGYSSSERLGIVNHLRVFRKCTNRICAEFHETLVKDSKAFTSDGVSPSKELITLRPCTVAGVAAMCPNNAAYYLDAAYGSDWLTRPLLQLF